MISKEDFDKLIRSGWIFKPQDGLWYHKRELWAGYKPENALNLAKDEERKSHNRNSR